MTAKPITHKSREFLGLAHVAQRYFDKHGVHWMQSNEMAEEFAAVAAQLLFERAQDLLSDRA